MSSSSVSEPSRRSSPFSNRYLPTGQILLGPTQGVFNPATQELALKITKQQHQKIQEQIGRMLAQQGHFGLARRRVTAAGSGETIPSLQWIAKALQQTSQRQGADPIYQGQAAQVSLTLEKKEKMYEEAIAALKKAAQEQDIGSLFDQFSMANSLRPDAFEPYTYLLSLLPFFASRIDKEAVQSVLKDAYTISSLRTFITVFPFFIINPNPLVQRDSWPVFKQAILDLFPTEVLLAANGVDQPSQEPELREETLRNAFCEHLAQGLNAVRLGDGESAREAFSSANLYHISDSRPYFYKVALALRGEDLAFATKHTVESQRLIDWFNPEEREYAGEELFSRLQKERPLPAKPPSSCRELPVLKAALPLFQKGKERQEKMVRFCEAMKGYLEGPKVDLIWAGLVLDMGRDCFEEEPKELIELSYLFLARIYGQLEALEVDLSEYKDIIQKDKGRILISYNMLPLTTPPQPQKAALSIDPGSLEIGLEEQRAVFREMFWDRYNDLGIYFTLFNQSNSVLKLLDTLPTKENDSEVYSPLLSQLLIRLNSKGTFEQRKQMTRWFAQHVSLCPPTLQAAITNSIYLWQLDQPIPCQDREMSECTSLWLDATRGKEEASDTPLSLAFKAWTFAQQGKWKEVDLLLEEFFQRWKEEMVEGEIDPLVLQVACLCRALSQERELMAIPLSKLKYHSEMAGCALSILAREGVGPHWAIPKRKLSARATERLARLYFGPMREENEKGYAQRIKQMDFPDFTDLRQGRKVGLDYSVAPDEGWSFPAIRTLESDRTIQAMREEMQRYSLREAHNQNIAAERPTYTDDAPFIEWVQNKGDLIEQYLATPEKTVQEFRGNFPAWPENARARFLHELKKKREHLQAFDELKQKTPKPEEKPARRFWQLVEQATSLIPTIDTYDRNASSYDLFVSNQQEARFVMNLFYEWGRKHWQGDTKEFEDGFHGPETHVWGEAPRIPHYNAGVFSPVRSKLENIHIFFKQI